MTKCCLLQVGGRLLRCLRNLGRYLNVRSWRACGPLEGGQLVQQLSLQLCVEVLLWRRGDDVLHLCGILVVWLTDDIVKFCSLVVEAGMRELSLGLGQIAWLATREN